MVGGDRLLRRWTFDMFSSPDGTISIYETEDFSLRLVIQTEERMFELRADYDQWGVWYNMTDFSPVGEGLTFPIVEGTRSFLKAFIKALEFLAEYDFTDEEPTEEICREVSWRKDDEQRVGKDEGG